MGETGWFRGEGGGLHEFALPLPPLYAEQVAKGRLTPVAAPGGPTSAAPPTPEPAVVDDVDSGDGVPVRPSPTDTKAVWVAYAVAVSDLSETDAKAMTKPELIERFGG